MPPAVLSKSTEAPLATSSPILGEREANTGRKDLVGLPELANTNTDAQLNMNWRKTVKFLSV